MLRKALLLIGFALLVLGLGAWLLGMAGGLPMMFWGGVLGVLVLIERWRYRSTRASSSGTWQATGERFIDPESGRSMQVLYNPSTGERRYEPALPDRPTL
ncbi:MAG TPA: hypothetical protein VEE84_03195 [Burkholderiaceae bacterium]|nr:hypothetical protein [Burkholderiaceae bacterium]